MTKQNTVRCIYSSFKSANMLLQDTLTHTNICSKLLSASYEQSMFIHLWTNLAWALTQPCTQNHLECSSSPNDQFRSWSVFTSAQKLMFKWSTICTKPLQTTFQGRWSQADFMSCHSGASSAFLVSCRTPILLLSSI